jgi:N-acetylmuramoyl-L-alanine amidase
MPSSIFFAAVLMAASAHEGTSVTHPPVPPLPIEQQRLSYVERLDARTLTDIELLVLHATETPTLASARAFAEIIHYTGSQTGNSGHFYIDRDGSVLQYVPLERVAHHVRGHNAKSIGIELINTGRFPQWFHSQSQVWSDPYTKEQVDSLLVLIEVLKQECPNLGLMSRHSDLDQREVASEDQADLMVRRKLDPGATFPWDEVLNRSGLEWLTE